MFPIGFPDTNWQRPLSQRPHMEYMHVPCSPGQTASFRMLTTRSEYRFLWWQNMKCIFNINLISLDHWNMHWNNTVILLYQHIAWANYNILIFHPLTWRPCHSTIYLNANKNIKEKVSAGDASCSHCVLYPLMSRIWSDDERSIFQTSLCLIMTWLMLRAKRQ